MCHSLDWYVGVANLIQDFVLKLWKFYLGFKDIIAGLTVPKCITVNEICRTPSSCDSLYVAGRHVSSRNRKRKKGAFKKLLSSEL